MISSNNANHAGRPRLVTDEQIFEALALAITANGPHKWTLTDVANHLDLTGPALGYRFGNKRGLLVAFAAHQPDATVRHFDRVSAAARSPRAAIIESLVGLISTMKTRAEVANNVAMLSLDLTDSELARHAKHQARIIKTGLYALVRDCGDVSDQSAKRIADDLYVVWSGAIIAWAIDGESSLAASVGSKLDACLDSHGI